MAVTYFQRDSASDLTGPAGSAAFTGGSVNANGARALATTGESTTEWTTGNMNAGINRRAWFFTEPDIPGADGATGDYAVTVRVTVANTNIGIRSFLARINSSGTVQSSEVEASQGSQTATGTRTYTWTNLNLGTWSSGDRLRVEMRFTNDSSVMNQSCSFSVNTADDTIDTPFTAGEPEPSEGTPTFAVNAAMAATGEAPAAEPSEGTAALTANAVMAATGEAPSGGPTGLVATPVSTTQIDLEWDAFTGALGYSIERDDVVIASDVQTLTYEDTGLEPNTEYKYRVGAEVSA